MKYQILDSEETKIIKAENFNHTFDKITGEAKTWGKAFEEDPTWCPIGPIIADIEISTICKGIPNKNGVKTPCSFCYKSNTPIGKNMSFEIFKKIADKLPKTITQIAFGADSELTSNPDIWKILAYSRKLGIVPNITTANVSDEVARNLKKYTGAVAISLYNPKDVCYNSVKKLTDLGMNQINIHAMVSEETLSACFEVIEDMKNDPRLNKMNAVVFLSLKPKNRGSNFHSISDKDYKKLVDRCLKSKINFGFDSCSASKFLRAVKGHIEERKFKQLAEQCESTRFSMYIDANGRFFPCSFMEEVNSSKVGNWSNGIDVVNCKDFLKDIWHNPLVNKFRKVCIECTNSGIDCPQYDI